MNNGSEESHIVKEYLSILIGMVSLAFVLIFLTPGMSHDFNQSQPNLNIVPDEYQPPFRFIIEVRPAQTEQEHRLNLRDDWFSVLSCNEGLNMAAIGNGWYRCTINTMMRELVITERINHHDYILNQSEIRIYQLSSDGLKQTIDVNYKPLPLTHH